MQRDTARAPRLYFMYHIGAIERHDSILWQRWCWRQQHIHFVMLLPSYGTTNTKRHLGSFWMGYYNNAWYKEMRWHWWGVLAWSVWRRGVMHLFVGDIPPPIISISNPPQSMVVHDVNFLVTIHSQINRKNIRIVLVMKRVLFIVIVMLLVFGVFDMIYRVC